jgi:hypothetical protein
MTPKTWAELTIDERDEIRSDISTTEVANWPKGLEAYSWAKTDESPPPGQTRSPWRGYKDGALDLVPMAWTVVTHAALEEYCRKKDEATLTVRISPKAAELVAELLLRHALHRDKLAGQMMQENNTQMCLDEARESRELAAALSEALAKWNENNPLGG